MPALQSGDRGDRGDISTYLVAGIWAERMRFTLGSDELQTTVTLPPTDDALYFLRILEVE